MALSSNEVITYEENFLKTKRGIVDGAIHIYKSALLNYEAANIGYVKLADDVASEEFAGIALEEKDLAAADNTSDGTYDTEIYAKGCNKVFLLKVDSGCTIANIGDTVYAKADDVVDLVAGVSNNVEVGTIVDIYSSTHAWVKI